MATVPEYVRNQIPSDVLIDVDLRPAVLLEMRFTPKRNEKGKAFLQPADPARWHAFVNRIEKRGKKGEPYNVRAVFTHDPGIRTAGANRLLWGTYRWIMAGLREKYSALSMETGKIVQCPFREEDDLHSALKHLAFGRTVVVVDGQEMEIEPTTTLLDREQFGFFYELVCRWANDHGISIPSPEEMFG